jgi:hypothetical protein
MDSKFTYVVDPVARIKRTMIVDSERPYSPVVQLEQDIEPILAACARDRDLHPARSTNKVVAKVPIGIYEQSIHEQWDESDWKKWLNDPQNKPFRVWQGKV